MKTVTKHFLLLSLMVFGVAGAAWAINPPQKYTGPVAFSDLQQGDTLAPGFSITGLSSQTLNFQGNRYKQDGMLGNNNNGVVGNNVTGYGGDNPVAIIVFGTLPFTPVDESGQDGNAWVVTLTDNNYVRIGGITIELTPDPYVPALDELTGNWNFLMPSGSRKVNVQFYNDYKLMNIPEGWTVKVYGQPVALQGDTATIYESAQVTLVPTDPRRVKSVTLQNDVSYITVAGLQLIGKDGDSWATIRDNNPDKIDLVSGYVYRYTDGAELKEGVPSASCGSIDSVNSESSNYNADTESHQEYRWCQSN